MCVLGECAGGVNSSKVIHRCLKDFSYNLFAAARFGSKATSTSPSQSLLQSASLSTHAAFVLFPFMAFLVLKSEIVSAALNDATMLPVLPAPLHPPLPFRHRPCFLLSLLPLPLCSLPSAPASSFPYLMANISAARRII